MKHRSKLLMLILLAVVARPIAAQDENPLAEDEPRQARPAEREDDPAVRALIASNPQTPSDLLHAVSFLVDLRRYELAQQYSQKFLQLQIEPKTSYGLLREFGSATMLRLARTTDLGDDGSLIADSIFGGADQYTRDPQRIAELIEQLGSPEEHLQVAAIVALRSGRNDAVVALMNVLSDSDRASEHVMVRRALAGQGDVATEPLIAALASKNQRFRAQVVETLGQLNRRAAIVHLLAPSLAENGDPKVAAAADVAIKRLIGRSATRDAAVRLLKKRLLEYLGEKVLLSIDADNNSKLWQWDPKKKTPVMRRLPHRMVLSIRGASLARDLFAILPKDSEVQHLYLISILEEAKRVGGLDHPLPKDPGSARLLAGKVGVGPVHRVLVDSMRRNVYLPAAVAAAEILADIGDESLIISGGSSPAPLVRAAVHSNRRLRFAAVSTIMKLAPKKSYAGSSYVLETMAYLAACSGNREALVAGRSAEQAASMAGWLLEVGFKSKISTGRRALLELAFATPDAELLLLDMNLCGLQTKQLIDRLRDDSRTAQLPIGLVSRPEWRGEALRLAEVDPLTIIVPHAKMKRSMQRQITQLLDLSDPYRVELPQRVKQSSVVLSLLAEISSRRQRVYDLRRYEDVYVRALAYPHTSSSAATIMGNLGTHRSQRALINLASAAGRPLLLRKSAGNAFSQSVRRFGVQLTSQDIDRQYARYNQGVANKVDEPTFQVLTNILNAMEGKAKIEK